MSQLNNHVMSAPEVLKRLLRDHVAPFKKQVMLAIFFMIIVAICSAVIVRLTQPIVDQVLIEQDKNMLFWVSIFIITVYLVKGTAEFYQSYLIKFVGQKILTDLQMVMYEHLLRSDFLVLQSQSSGKLISRFTNDIILMRRAISDVLVGCAKYLLSVVFLIGIMFSLDPFLSVFVFLVFPAAIYPIQKLGRKMRKLVSSTQEELSNFTAKLDETFRGIKVIKSSCAEEREVSDARKIVDQILELYRKSTKFDALTSPIMEVLSGLTIVCVICYGAYVIGQGIMTTGTLFTFITAFVSAYRPFKSLVALNVNLQESITAANRVFNILDMQPKITDHEHSKEALFHQASIEFVDVSMAFGEHDKAIDRLNLHIPAGKIYAFVGASGSGKTTITNLLTRMFDPSEGKIAIDGHDIAQIKLQSLRGQVSLVAQETILFDTSIAENIAYNKSSASLEEIIAAAKKADAHQFIMSLPDGYDTIVGNNGCLLSGGQRQRLSIARALLNGAPIMILDEATSAVDPKSEQEIMANIYQARIGKTTILITHRLSSAQAADRIIVLKKGQIVEQGTHEELIKLQGEYYKLHNKELQQQKKNV
jgi:subfamily B ATP-binding cassette protein MsbA